MSVAVGIGVEVAVGTKVNVGVAVGSGAKTEQEDRKRTVRKTNEGIIFFCMGCILPLVAKITGLFDKN